MTITSPSIKTILEPASEIRVLHEADVLVVGGGPGGHSAAVAAARSGARTVLIERYGHLGGMATGGLVLMIPHLSDGTEKPQIMGLCQEWVDRLKKHKHGVKGPELEDLGKTDKELVDYWRDFCAFFIQQGRIQYGYVLEPELAKCMLNDMVEESGVKLLLHSWGTKPIMAGNEVQGVFFESKSGRQAILAKITIDATGDGDLLPGAGAAFDARIDPKLRISRVAVVFRIGKIDTAKNDEFRYKHPDQWAEMRRECMKLGGYPSVWKTTHNDTRWVNNAMADVDILKVEDLTRSEVEIRKRMLITIDYFNKNVPGYENAVIIDTASQTGTRGGRRLIGEHMVTEEDWKANRKYKDTIAAFPHLRFNVSEEHQHVQIPYRSIVPIEVENLLVAGRSFSSDQIVNNDYNLIPHCIAIGHAAGTAAAQAVKEDVKPRHVRIGAVQEQLVRDGCVLPEGLPGT